MQLAPVSCGSQAVSKNLDRVDSMWCDMIHQDPWKQDIGFTCDMSFCDTSQDQKSRICIVITTEIGNSMIIVIRGC